MVNLHIFGTGHLVIILHDNKYLELMTSVLIMEDFLELKFPINNFKVINQVCIYVGYFQNGYEAQI